MRLDLRGNRWQRIGADHYWQGYAWKGEAPWTPADYRGEILTELLSQLNGCFAWAGRVGGQIFAATDRLGSYPLFYGKGRITDRLVREELIINPKWLNQETWRYVEALPGNHTLDNDYRSLPPQSLLSASADVPKINQYPFATEDSAVPAQLVAGNRGVFFETVMNCCRRLIRHAAGRPVVVLLSDGYDSRLLLAALHLLRYPNLHAATYGIRGNGVVERAGEVAYALKVPWYFLDYSVAAHAEFLRDFYPKLTAVAANGQSVPQEQECFAAHALSYKFPAGAILVPGISGDLQAGSYVPPYSFRWPGGRTTRALREWLRTRLTRIPNDHPAAATWKAAVGISGEKISEAEAIRRTEKVIVYERLTKYLCTTLRTYEMQGLEWYLPLWDRDFLEFWRRQPPAVRRWRAAYREWCRDDFFAPLSIHFRGEGDKPSLHWGRVMRRFLPFGDRMVSGVPDPNEFSRTITSLVGREVGPTEVNAALGEWLMAYYRR